ncbi:follistatin-related protein 1-like isoform X1 [Crassostrea virginica]|uniref:Follistatin-related protein 1 n=1 Tax=Crassostrea virginica TaxID=6565 RepID=A0A8B8D0A9_CRAVI|nr:follistatin-related protein 1-like isoform X2 [Crassostrea virginica]
MAGQLCVRRNRKPLIVSRLIVNKRLLLAIFLQCLIVVCMSETNTTMTDEDLCFLKLCKAGRQCVVINKVATCQCVTYCPDHMHLVCGNDGRTYHNPCQLHQTACIEQRHIKVAEKGPCIVNNKEIRKLKNSTWKPLKCKEDARVYIRKIFLMELMLKNGRDDVVAKRTKIYFKSVDADTDIFVTSDEIYHFLRQKKNVKSTDISKSFRQKIACIDAMIDLVDKNKDYKLDQEEFTELLRPELVPFSKGCLLAGIHYSDGESTLQECNTCVCREGKMECSAHDCSKVGKGSENSTPSDYQKNILNMIKELLTKTSKQ